MDREDRCVRLIELAAEEYRTIGEYERLADEEEDPAVREAFMRAAQDEARHFRAFLDAFQRWCGRPGR